MFNSLFVSACKCFLHDLTEEIRFQNLLPLFSIIYSRFVLFLLNKLLNTSITDYLSWWSLDYSCWVLSVLLVSSWLEALASLWVCRGIGGCMMYLDSFVIRIIVAFFPVGHWIAKGLQQIWSKSFLEIEGAGGMISTDYNTLFP